MEPLAVMLSKTHSMSSCSLINKKGNATTSNKKLTLFSNIFCLIVRGSQEGLTSKRTHGVSEKKSFCFSLESVDKYERIRFYKDLLNF